MTVKKTPMRMCLVCREMKPKQELLRVVKTKDGKIFADPTGKAGGRGAYICKNSVCIEKAAKTNALSRCFCAPVAQETYELLREATEKVEG